MATPRGHARHQLGYGVAVPTPAFIVELRETIGHAPLWLSGVCGVVFDDAGRILLTQRVEHRRWALVGGILEPGEQPAQAMTREIREETGVEAEVERLAAVVADAPIVVPNGDQCQFLTLTFRCRYVAGRARVADEENIAVGWFAREALPQLKESALRRIEHASAPEGPPYFLT